MSAPLRILLLSSGRLGVPTAQQLAAGNVLVGLAAPDTDPRTAGLLSALATSLQQPFYGLSPKTFSSVLEALCRDQRPDAVFVVGFPWRIPEPVLALPHHGFFNFHAGPLPGFRGPDPIFEAIRQQAPETALTVHRMDAGFDTGAVVLEDRFALDNTVTHGLLQTQMAFRAAQAAKTVADCLQAGTAATSDQPATDSHYWPRVATDGLYLRWQTQPAAALAALIRACNPIYGGAATFAGGWNFRLLDAAVAAGVTHTAPAGTLLQLSPEHGALIQCIDQAVLQVRVIGTDEGYFPADRLQSFGLQPGLALQDP